jgi:hypothetical protein
MDGEACRRWGVAIEYAELFSRGYKNDDRSRKLHEPFHPAHPAHLVKPVHSEEGGAFCACQPYGDPRRFETAREEKWGCIYRHQPPRLSLGS